MATIRAALIAVLVVLVVPAGLASQAMAQTGEKREMTLAPPSFVRGTALPAWIAGVVEFPALDSHAPVEFSEFASWREVSEWAERLFVIPAQFWRKAVL